MSLEKTHKFFRFFPFLIILDGASTAWAFYFGGHEQNLLPRFFLKAWGIPGLFVYTILVFLILSFFSRFLIRHSKNVFLESKFIKLLWITVMIVFYAVACYWLVIISGNLLIPLKLEELKSILPWLIFGITIIWVVYYTSDEFTPIIWSLFEKK